MRTSCTPKRLRDGETEWFCENCSSWVSGKLIEVTCYTDLVCEGCDTTLEQDYYGFKEIENEQKPY